MAPQPRTLLPSFLPSRSSLLGGGLPIIPLLCFPSPSAAYHHRASLHGSSPRPHSPWGSNSGSQPLLLARHNQSNLSRKSLGQSAATASYRVGGGAEVTRGPWRFLLLLPFTRPGCRRCARAPGGRGRGERAPARSFMVRAPGDRNGETRRRVGLCAGRAGGWLRVRVLQA